MSTVQLQDAKWQIQSQYLEAVCHCSYLPLLRLIGTSECLDTNCKYFAEKLQIDQILASVKQCAYQARNIDQEIQIIKIGI